MPEPFIAPVDLVDLLGRGGTADPGMLIACDAASDICRHVAETSFTRGTSSYSFDGTGTDTILLTDLPVTAVGTVSVNGTAVTDYTLGGNGVLYRGTAGAFPRPTWPEGRQNVALSGVVHGYTDDDFPRDVRIVALNIAARIVVQGVALEESIGATRIKYAAGASDLTNTERFILRKYRPTR